MGNESQIPNPISGVLTLRSNLALTENYNSGGNLLQRTANSANAAVDPLFGNVNPGTTRNRAEQQQLAGTLQIPGAVAHILGRPSSKSNFSQSNLFATPLSLAAAGKGLHGGALLSRAPGGGVAPGTFSGRRVPDSESNASKKKAITKGNAAPDVNGSRRISAKELKTYKAGDRMAAELMSGQSRRIAAQEDAKNKGGRKKKNRMPPPRSTTRKMKR